MPECFNFLKIIRLLGLLAGLAMAWGAAGQQSAKLDSLQQALDSSKDTTRFNVLFQLHLYYRQGEATDAFQYAKQAHQLAEALGDSVRIVRGARMMAYSLDDLGKNDEVIAILNQALGIAERNRQRYPQLKTDIRFILNNAGIAYMHRGSYDSSLQYHFRSLQIREEEGDKRSQGTPLNNIGLVYFKLENYESAIEFYLRSLALKKELKDNVDIEKILINIGLCYNGLGEFRKALDSFNEALQACGGTCSDVVVKEANYGLGIAHNRLRDFDKAKENFNKSLEIAKRQNDVRYWIEDLIGLSRVETTLGNYNGSLQYLSEANKLANESDYAELMIKLYQEFARVYQQTADYKNASLFQERYIGLKDSIYSGELIRNLARIQTNYEERENRKTIQARDRDIQVQREQISRQRQQYFFIVVITILIIGLTSVLYWANNRQRKHNIALNEANNRLDMRVQEKTRDLFLTNEALNQVNEELDNFIYRTSHDIRGPLVTLKGVCNVALLDVKDTLALDYLRKLDITADKLNTILTRLLIVNQINHSELEPVQIDFIRIIEDILVLEKKKGLPSNLSIQYEVSPHADLFSDRQLVKIILENLIDNAIKFYNTSTRIEPFVKIKIEDGKRDKIFIRVTDNGIGISQPDKDQIFHLFTRASERSETGGIGLYLSKLATHRLGGEITLADTSEKGSEFLVVFPTDLGPILEKRKEEEEQRKKEKERRDREKELERARQLRDKNRGKGDVTMQRSIGNPTS